eukprot:SAG31_NODE_1186_length_9492_cov_70.124987_6_plen_100_part_00
MHGDGTQEREQSNEEQTIPLCTEEGWLTGIVDVTGGIRQVKSVIWYDADTLLIARAAWAAYALDTAAPAASTIRGLFVVLIKRRGKAKGARNQESNGHH